LLKSNNNKLKNDIHIKTNNNYREINSKIYYLLSQIGFEILTYQVPMMYPCPGKKNWARKKKLDKNGWVKVIGEKEVKSTR
jgi:hypothetical protein